MDGAVARWSCKFAFKCDFKFKIVNYATPTFQIISSIALSL